MAIAAAPDDVQIEMPDKLRPLVTQAMAPIVASARLDDLGDVQQLYRRVRPVIRNVLGAQGYFSATLTRLREHDSDLDPNPKLRMKLEPGEQSVIKDVSIKFVGAVAADTSEMETYRQSLRGSWKLQTGEPFDQAKWDASKGAILDRLLARNFPAASISSSKADVDSQAQEVYLRVVYDSGPAFTFGNLKISGLSKYPERVVAGYNSIKPGDPYEQERLLQLLSDLQNTVYFSSVDVRISPDPAHHENVPIEVTVVESDSKRIGLGAGYSSNTGFRSELTYSLNNLFDRGYSLVNGVRLEQKRQSAFADVYLPPSEKGIQDSVGISLDNQTLGGLKVERTSFGAIRKYLLQNNVDLSVGLNFQLERRESDGISLGQAKALVAGASATRSRVDDRLNPTRGYVAFGQMALASESLASDQDFLRLAGKVQQYWTPKPDHLITARLEVGTVLASLRRDIPQDYLFRAGGSNSVRGIQFLGLGVVDQGVLQGGRRLAVASLEYVHWLNGPVGAAVFTDVGDVADSFGELDPIPSIGFGVRYKTPAGPLAFDLAKAKGEDTIRFHFALGVTF